jgi:lysophospholipase L1-like esterase
VQTRRRRWPTALVAAVLLVFASCGGDGGGEPIGSTHDPFPEASFRIAALGDSYISGEGAGRYLDGTDESTFANRNQCHRATTAHPFLVANQLEASMVLIACSGALTGHVTGTDATGRAFPPQYRRSREGVFGSQAQLADLRESTQDLDAVLISIGGNDADFSTIGGTCVTFLDCSKFASHWVGQLESQVYPAMARTYAAVRKDAGSAEVFALTYPNPLRPRYCDDLSGVEREEWEFLGSFIKRLNEKVEAAAADAGVRVIDLRRALNGHRFCDSGKTGINFIQPRLESATIIDIAHPVDLVRESLHPNVLGHKLMAEDVLPRLRALQAETLPPPPEPAPELPPPAPPEPPPSYPFPAGTPCQGGELTAVLPVLAPPEQREVAFSNARPGSTACFRVKGAEWGSRQVGAAGRVRVPIDVTAAGEAGVNEILVQGIGGNWKQIVVSRTPADA